MEIENLKTWQAFIAVAERGNFSCAGKHLGVPVPQISKRVAKLEQSLGARLFHRSTRVVSLTDEGKALLPKINKIIDDLTEVEQNFQTGKLLTGTVKVTCVPYVAHHLIAPLLNSFWELYPNIKFDFQLTKSFINMIEHNIDMAVRIENPRNSELIYRKLAPNNLILCASPSYLKFKNEPINEPKDLIKHDLLLLKIHEKVYFKKKDISLNQFKNRKKIECDNGNFLTDLALNGHGILIRAKWDVANHIKRGNLVEVLPEYPLETFGHIHAVIPSNRYLAPRVRAFFDFIVHHSKAWTN